MDEVKLALEMSKLVHDECKDVPHDIGLRLLEIVKMNVNEQLHQPAIVGQSEQLVCEYCNEDAKPTCCDSCLEGMVNAVQKAN